jgi:GH35 family endo-1,4-beta-xylanase
MGLLALKLPGFDGHVQAQSPPASVDIKNLPRLKDLYAKDFLIGTTLDFRSPDEFSPREMEIIKSQFDIITPENSMKPAQIHPAEKVWNWTVADRLVSFCQANNIEVAGHTLAWHAQTGNWFFVGTDGKPVTRDVALARLKDHIETEVGHFKGKVKAWDVVNEAISDGAWSEGENLRQSPWIRAISPEYITEAFKFAHEADPAADLYYNDYNIERGAKHQSSLVLLKRLIKEGAPINGVGIQGHWSLNYLPYDDIDKAISDYESLGLKVNISELDITIAGQGGGQLTPVNPATGNGQPATMPTTGPARRRGNRRMQSAPPTPQQLQAQAAAYARLFEIFLKHKHSIGRITIWGLNDRRSWRPGQSPLLFDQNSNPKPALQAIADVKAPK